MSCGDFFIFQRRAQRNKAHQDSLAAQELAAALVKDGHLEESVVHLLDHYEKPEHHPHVEFDEVPSLLSIRAPLLMEPHIL